MKPIVKKYLRYARILRAKIARKLMKERPHRALPEQKHEAVKSAGIKSGLHVLIETGTYRGDMINAVKNVFKKIYSIELGEDLALKARKRFAALPNINIIQGDSARKIPDLSNKIQEPAVFWLDAHFSGDDARGDEVTPIIGELRTVLARPYQDLILIDDARLFDGVDYPTISQIRALVRKLRPELSVRIENDIIYIYKHD